MSAHQRKLRRVGLVKRITGWFFATSVGLAFLAACAIAVAVGVVLFTYHEYSDQYVAPDKVALNSPSKGAVILDRNGQVLYEFVDDQQGYRMPVKLEDVSPYLVAATIATEDSSFFQNPGVNFKGIARATSESVESLLKGGAALGGTGGSSITQQLVKQVYIPEDEKQEKSLDRKMREMVYAAEITKQYSKEQILEWYLNEINYGGIYTGVEAASWGYFGKSAKDLTLGEATLLAGIPQSPGLYDPKSNMEGTLVRRNQVADQMEKHPLIDIGNGQQFTVNQDDLTASRNEPVTLVEHSIPIQAPHFVLTYVLPQLEQMFGRDALLHDGLVITTSLDLDLQERSQTALEQWIRTFEAGSNTHNGATSVIDPNTGEILVMLGSRDYWRQDINGEINNLLASNSPGSTFKPFIYLTSFMDKGWTPETIIEDTPVSFREANGTFFSPTNPNKGFMGPVTIRNALGNSLNVPAFKAALEVGVPAVLNMARKFGFTDLGDSYGPSIAIGGVDLKALDLAYGYGVLANDGVMAGQDTFAPASADEAMVGPVSILRVLDATGGVRWDINDHRARQQIVPPDKAQQVSSILSDPSAQCLTFGCGGLGVPGHVAAVKTGTSEPYDPAGPDGGKIGETWAFGYTQDVVVGVWAGNSNNAPLDHILSTSISFNAMRDIMLQAYRGPGAEAAP
jgi:membrane peptidoglycan carboxypeptidase